jgi:hypothetical protein
MNVVHNYVLIFTWHKVKKFGPQFEIWNLWLQVAFTIEIIVEIVFTKDPFSF